MTRRILKSDKYCEVLTTHTKGNKEAEGLNDAVRRKQLEGH